MTWFQIWTVCWQVAVFLTPLLVGIAVLWLKSQFVTKADATSEKNRVDAHFASDKVERDGRYDILREKTQDHETRLRMVEADVAKPPSRHVLNNAIATMQGGIHSLGKSLDQLRGQMESQGSEARRQIETQNQYLHALIDKHLK